MNHESYLDVVERDLEAGLGGAQRAGADVQAAAVQARHGDLEALALLGESVLRKRKRKRKRKELMILG